MISKNRAKYIISLQQKKVRDEERLYVIEGDKLVTEFLQSGIHIKMLIAKPEFISSLSSDMKQYADIIEEAGYEELKHISSLKTPHNVLAVVPMPNRIPDTPHIPEGLTAALDFVQDPGNLGTIIRAAAWFGIKNIVCSPDCADVYNPKVIQASMGAILHVNVYYSDLKIFLEKANGEKTPVYGTMLEGSSVYDHKPGNKGIILLGNESKGISEDLMPYVTDKIVIPGACESTQGIDSLNVGMAASIVFYEFSRKAVRLPD